MISKLKFMVLGGPRSGTTWLANWLTTERTLCVHEPLMRADPTMIDKWAAPLPYASPGRILGISCTASALLYPDWARAHSARKIVIHRRFDAINRSLEMADLPKIDHRKRVKLIETLDEIPGLHVDYNELFSTDVEKSKEIARNLFLFATQLQFDASRFLELRDMNVQPVKAIIDECRRRAKK